MKKMRYTLLFTLCSLLFGIDVKAQDRGLHASVSEDGTNVFVSWRMRGIDAANTLHYKLYADDKLVTDLIQQTCTSLPLSYRFSTLRLEITTPEGKPIEPLYTTQVDSAFYHDIPLIAPTDCRGLNATYTPEDATSFDVDGDGQEEIVLKWTPSNAHDNSHRGQTSPVYLDCYKLNGTRLWRINLGWNIRAGAHYTQFLCYDFDRDGRGELIVKTAPGTLDGTGVFLSKGVAANADHSANYYDENGMVARGKEWLTCFDGTTGRELMTVDYWPYFDIRDDWDPRPTRRDDERQANRGCRFKACVAFLPDSQGVTKPCAVMNRGYYSYSYFAAYSWDGKELATVWQHSSDKDNEGVFGEGAHSLSVGDVDNDGYDEILVGAACLDHDGTVLWRTGLGHGDALHLGDFDPSRPGLEVYRITEVDTKYDACLMDAATGEILAGLPLTKGDVGRGLILNCDAESPGSEFMARTRNALFSCHGDSLAPLMSGRINNLNFRIYWDGDLLDEYHDHRYVSKWDHDAQTWKEVTNFGKYDARSTCGTKDIPILQTDLYGDFREEVIYYVVDKTRLGEVKDFDPSMLEEPKQPKRKPLDELSKPTTPATLVEKPRPQLPYSLRIFSTTIPTIHRLPWLREDHVYDMSVVWQNCAYNQPPHLGYDPFETNR